MLPDPHVINLHRGGRTDVTSGRILQDDEHRRGSDAGGHAPDIDAVIIIGDASRLPVRGKSMPAVRIIPAGAANPLTPLGLSGPWKCAQTWPLRPSAMSISPSSGQFWPSVHTPGQLATSPGFPGTPGSHTRASIKPYVKLNLPIVLTRPAAYGFGIAAILALLDKRQAQRPAALADLGGIVTVILRGVGRTGNARTVPAGRPLGRVQAGAVELIVELERPVAGHAGPASASLPVGAASASVSASETEASPGSAALPGSAAMHGPAAMSVPTPSS